MLLQFMRDNKSNKRAYLTLTLTWELTGDSAKHHPGYSLFLESKTADF